MLIMISLILIIACVLPSDSFRNAFPYNEYDCYNFLDSYVSYVMMIVFVIMCLCWLSILLLVLSFLFLVENVVAVVVAVVVVVVVEEEEALYFGRLRLDRHAITCTVHDMLAQLDIAFVASAVHDWAWGGSQCMQHSMHMTQPQFQHGTQPGMQRFNRNFDLPIMLAALPMLKRFFDSPACAKWPGCFWHGGRGQKPHRLCLFSSRPRIWERFRRVTGHGAAPPAASTEDQVWGGQKSGRLGNRFKQKYCNSAMYNFMENTQSGV